VPRDAAILLVWPLIMAAFAAQLVFSADFTWSQAMRSSLHDWLPWLLLSPLVWILARHFPLERGRLRWSVPLHVVACAAAIAFAGWFTDVARLGAPGPPPGAAFPGPRGEARRLERERAIAAAAGTEEAGSPALPPQQQARPGGPPGPRGPAGRGRVQAEVQRRFLHLLVWTRTKLDLPVYWIVVSVAHALAFYRRAEERARRTLELEAGLSQAKLEALRLQLQPHFLFNTLNAVSTLVHRDPEAADEMIASLSQMLRVSLETREQEVPLRRELELLDCYLEIEQVRLGERLRVERDIDPGVLEARVPALVLQTLAENAVRHGLEPRNAPGLLALQASRSGDRLRIVVRDDGVGLKPADSRTERRGIGLANTEARLRELHGNAASLVLREPPEGGVVVEIELPYRTATATPAGGVPS
jgi:two-component sensor histidine kinase